MESILCGIGNEHDAGSTSCDSDDVDIRGCDEAAQRGKARRTYDLAWGRRSGKGALRYTMRHAIPRGFLCVEQCMRCGSVLMSKLSVECFLLPYRHGANTGKLGVA